MDYITRFIKFHELIKEEKKGKYPFEIFNTDPHNKSGTKKTYYYLIFMGLMDLNILLLTMMKK